MLPTSNLAWDVAYYLCPLCGRKGPEVACCDGEPAVAPDRPCTCPAPPTLQIEERRAQWRDTSNAPHSIIYVP
ncbi:MAG: hypothetical protein ACYCW6_00085 [Candidatus Xenobia bacterium]